MRQTNTKQSRASAVENSIFMQALMAQPVDRTPVWLMRQAGRYMPTYRKIRAKAKDFIEMCQDPKMACEITLLPIQQFDLDAAIIFSDILLIGQALGAPLAFVEGKGPIFEPVTTHKQIENLRGVEAAADLSFVSEACQMVVNELGNTPLIGFCGSPWTVATYMVEGGTSKQFETIKKMAWTAPKTLSLLLDKLTEATITYLKSQVHAGVDALMIFDTWGGILPQFAFETFSLNYIQKIVQELKADPTTQHTPIIAFAKGVNTALDKISSIGVQGVSLDWTINLSYARKHIPNNIAIQGNLDPTILLGDPEFLRQSIVRVLDSNQNRPGHIFNLGHGILPQTPPEQVARLVDWVHEYSLSNESVIES